MILIACTIFICALQTGSSSVRICTAFEYFWEPLYIQVYLDRILSCLIVPLRRRSVSRFYFRVCKTTVTIVRNSKNYSLHEMFHRYRTLVTSCIVQKVTHETVQRLEKHIGRSYRLVPPQSPHRYTGLGTCWHFNVCSIFYRCINEDEPVRM